MKKTGLLFSILVLACLPTCLSKRPIYYHFKAEVLEKMKSKLEDPYFQSKKPVLVIFFNLKGRVLCLTSFQKIPRKGTWAFVGNTNRFLRLDKHRVPIVFIYDNFTTSPKRMIVPLGGYAITINHQGDIIQEGYSF